MDDSLFVWYVCLRTQCIVPADLGIFRIFPVSLSKVKRQKKATEILLCFHIIVALLLICGSTGRAQLIGSHSLARISFELSGNSN